jgi:hypothetical protein
VTATGPASHPGFLEVALNSDVLQPVEALRSCAIPQKEATAASGAPQANTPPIEFTLSPYSFRFSDNTLLRSGNHFGIYLTRFDMVPDVLRVMRLCFVWFPRNFVPPRERPFDLDVRTSPPLAGHQ